MRVAIAWAVGRLFRPCCSRTNLEYHRSLSASVRSTRVALFSLRPGEGGGGAQRALSDAMHLYRPLLRPCHSREVHTAVDTRLALDATRAASRDVLHTSLKGTKGQRHFCPIQRAVHTISILTICKDAFSIIVHVPVDMDADCRVDFTGGISSSEGLYSAISVQRAVTQGLGVVLVDHIIFG